MYLSMMLDHQPNFKNHLSTDNTEGGRVVLIGQTTEAPIVGKSVYFGKRKTENISEKCRNF